MPLSIGYALTALTPTLDRPVYLAGFGQKRRAQSVHDDLTARALALRNDQAILVLCALDLIGFFRPYALEVARRVGEQYPGAQVILASTHTHHGPDTMGLWGPDTRHSGIDPEYLASVKKRLADVICQAIGAASRGIPAEAQTVAMLKAASVCVPGLAKNARNPEIVDDELACLQFIGLDGQPHASLFNFPCHPEVLWEHNPYITADYPGPLRDAVEADTGAPCIFFSGSLGGMMTPDVKEHSFAEAEQMGLALAASGLKALEETQIIDRMPEFSLRRAEIKIKVTNLLFKLAFRRGLLPDVRNRRGEVVTEVNLVRLGPLWLATVPGELLPKLGLALKACLQEAGAPVAGIIGLANDELGYILPEEDFRYPLNPFRPGKHYEETMSLGKQAGPLVVGAIKKILPVK